VTVCLAVLGKYIPALRFLAVLLGRQAALRPAARYYQRLLARDRYEAEAVVKEYLADHQVEALFDRVLVPALVLVRRGKKAGELRSEDEEFILQTTRAIVAAFAPVSTATSNPGAGVVLGVPAVDAADEAALDMLRHSTRAGGPEVLVAANGFALASGPQDAGPAAVLIAAVRPGGLTEAGYFCRRLRAQYPGAKIVVGWWGRGKDPKKARAVLEAAGADRVVTTLREARTYLAPLGLSALAMSETPSLRR
jgi:hypothetical protein